MARELAVTSPESQASTLRLDGSRVSLGRSTGNELCYPEDQGLSRQHVLLERSGEDWFVRDLGSKNGTFLNGVRLTERVLLRPGDRVAASRVVLVYDPVRAQAAKTVVFEGGPEPSGITVSTTLQRLLAGESGEAQAAPDQPSPLWASPVTALVRAGRELAVRRPLPELFPVILDLAIEAVGAKRGVLLTSHKGELVVEAWRGEGFRISTAVRDRVLEGKTSILVQDVSSDAALRDRASIVAQSVRSLMAVPLQTDERVIGLIYVDAPPFTHEFTNEDLNLLTVMANVAAIRIERERLAEIEQAERLLEAELEQAAEIQRRFLPTTPPVIEGVDLAGYNAPCRGVGGDYFDFLPYPDGRVGLVLADVAGKGMPAALMMTCLQAKVGAIAENALEPAELVTRLNRCIAATCPDNRFVTLFMGLLDPRSGELLYCNGGHNPPFLMRAGGELLTLEGGGPVLGILPGLSFTQQRCRIEPGDVVVMYSDGVTEACDPDGEEFGEERLAGLVRQHREASAEVILHAVREAVLACAAGHPLADDLTLLVARRT